MIINSVRLKTLPEQLCEYLSSSIIEGNVKPGEKLNENDLGTLFGISRSPIRECFRILESEGFVEITPRRGVFVTEIKGKDIEDVFPVRIALEGLAAELAVENICENDLETLNDLIIKMEKALIDNDIKSFIHFNYAFHSSYIKCSNNPALERTLRTLGKGTWLRLIYLYYKSSPMLESSNKTHKEILKSFKEKDVMSVKRLVEEHINKAKHGLLKLF